MPRRASYRGSTATPTLSSGSRSNPSPQTTRTNHGCAGSQAGASVKIPRPEVPPRGVSAKTRTGPNLQSQLQLPQEAAKQLIKKLRICIHKHLDISRTLARQDERAFEAYMKECRNISKLQNYVNYWPAEVYCKLYLTLSSARKHTNDRYRQLSQPERESSEMAEVKVGTLDRADSIPNDSIEPSQAIQHCVPQPPPHNAQDLSRGANLSEISVVCAPRFMSDFVARMDPPQPDLVEVLHFAGLHKWQDLQKLVGDSGLQDRFLWTLVQENQISRFQSCLIKDALREISPAIPE